MGEIIVKWSLLGVIFHALLSPAYTQNWKITQYTEEDGLPNNYLYAVTYDEERILLGTDAGLVTFDGHDFELQDYLKNTYPVALRRLSDSLLYIATYRNGIYFKTNNSLQKISSAQGNLSFTGNQSNLVLHAINYMTIFNHGIKTKTPEYPKGFNLSGGNDGVFFFKGKTLNFVDWEGNKKSITESKYDITALYTNEEVLFTGHKEGRLTRLKEGEIVQEFRLDTKDDIQSIYHYDDSSFFIVTTMNEYDQLYFVKYNRGLTELLEVDKLLDKKVEINDMYIRDGIVFCATFGEGLYVISSTDFLTINTYEQNIPKLENLIQDNEGVIWGNSAQNVYKISLEKGISKLIFKTNLVSLITVKNNKAFFTTTNGGNTGWIFDMNLNPIAEGDLIQDFYSTDSTILGHGKYSFLDINIEKNRLNKLFYIENQDSIYGRFNSGAYADSIVYLGTDNGLIKLKKVEDSNWQQQENDQILRHFKKKKITQLFFFEDILYVVAEGMLFYCVNDVVKEYVFSDLDEVKVNKIKFDSKSNLLIGTNKGFWYVKKNEILHYTTNNGLSSDRVYNFLEDNDSTIWIVTGKSIELIKHKNIRFVPAPKLFFKKITDIESGFSLTISSYQYHNPNDLELEYKLNDEKWVPLKTTFLELRNLAPKNYKCFIRGKRSNSDWSKPLVHEFEVYAKWYQTNAFKIIIFLILFILSFVFFRFRLKKVRIKNLILEGEIANRKKLEKKVDNLREEISQDFHDELGNKIASISGISNTIIKSSDHKDVSKIEEISKLSSEIYDSTKDFVWLLNPSNNNLKRLCLYLRDYGENYFDLIGDIDFFFEQKEIEEIPITYEWMKNIVLTFKEITANIVNHSGATEVTMKVKLYEKMFTIEIYDNGKGFDYYSIKHGSGLKNIEARMKRLEAKIITDYNNGVYYCFKLKLK